MRDWPRGVLGVAVKIMYQGQLYGVREWEQACFVAQLKVLFLIILEKVTREMGEGYYKLGANVGSVAANWRLMYGICLEFWRKL